jgi:hypothetical protein
MPDPDFDRFWAAYPRKQAKPEARKAWAKLAPSAALLDEMLAALAWQVASPQWTKDDGQYIPHPATWLRGERWSDEPVRVPTRGQAPSHAWTCPHTTRCASRWACERRRQIETEEVA